MLELLLGMKIHEKSWFNICSEPVRKVKDSDTDLGDFEDGGIIDEDFNEPNEPDVDEYE